jgi:hypothetical protein
MEENDILDSIKQEHKRLVSELNGRLHNEYDAGLRDAYEWIISTIEQQDAIEAISAQYQLKLFDTPDQTGE